MDRATLLATPFDRYLARGKDRYGDKFSADSLNPAFVRYYNSGQRVRVAFRYSSGHVETLTGTIGATTGWRPCFLLMRRSNAHGSSDTIGDNATVVAVKRGSRYSPV